MIANILFGNGPTSMGNLLPPLLTQAPGDQSSSDDTLDEANTSSSDPPTFGGVNLGANGLGRVRSSMLVALNRSIALEKSGYASNGSASTNTPPGAQDPVKQGK